MNNDMKCPFCGKQMYHPVGKATWSCQNWDCLKSEGMIGNHVLWQELIRTRKALDYAIERLEQMAHESFQGDQQSINMGFHIRAAAALTDIEQITALEQKD